MEATRQMTDSEALHEEATRRTAGPEPARTEATRQTAEPGEPHEEAKGRTTEPEAPRNRRVLVALLIWLSIAAGFTVVQVRQSLHDGWLAAPPTYDDIAYFVDAQSRLDTWSTAGTRQMISDALSDPPHSPWSTGVAAVAFMVAGPQEWAPAALNGVLVLGLLLLLAWRGRDLPIGWLLVIGAFLLTWPITGQAVVNSRPDIACGLVTAVTALVVATSPWVGAGRRWHYLAGAGLGVALLIKPTVSPVTLAVVLTAMAATTATDVVQGHPWRRWRPIAGAWGRCLAVALAIALPYYAVAHRNVIDYVRRNTFGELAEVWRLDLGLAEHARYYLTGTGGRFMLDAWLYLWLGLAVATLVVAVARRDAPALGRLPAAVAVFVVSYALVTVPAHKNQFLGALLPSLMLVSAMQMMLYLARVIRGTSATRLRYAGAVALSSLTLAGLVLVRPPASFAPWHPMPLDTISEHRALLDDVRQDIEDGGAGPAHVVFTNIGPYLNPPLLEFRSEPERGRELHAVDLAMSTDPNDLEIQLDVATDVLVFTQDNPSALQWVPAAADQQRVLDRLTDHPAYYLSSVHGTPGGGELFLFRPARSFSGIVELDGFGPIEGPYPELGLTDPVRWGLGPMSRFEIEVPPSGDMQLVLTAAPGVPGQTMTVMASGDLVAEHTFGSPGEFDDVVVDLELAPGRHTVELHYRDWLPPSETDARPLAVLFRALLASSAGAG